MFRLFEQGPDEVALQVLTHLDLDDLLRTQQVSRNLLRLGRDQIVLLPRFKERFGFRPSSTDNLFELFRIYHLFELLTESPLQDDNTARMNAAIYRKPLLESLLSKILAISKTDENLANAPYTNYLIGRYHYILTGLVNTWSCKKEGLKNARLAYQYLKSAAQQGIEVAIKPCSFSLMLFKTDLPEEQHEQYEEEWESLVTLAKSKNNAEILYWLIKLQANNNALQTLRNTYPDGDGRKALLHKAAEQGDANCQWRLGFQYLKQKRHPEVSLGFALLEQAAENDIHYAIRLANYYLGFGLYNSHIPLMDEIEAVSIIQDENRILPRETKGIAILKRIYKQSSMAAWLLGKYCLKNNNPIEAIKYFKIGVEHKLDDNIHICAGALAEVYAQKTEQALPDNLNNFIQWTEKAASLGCGLEITSFKLGVLFLFGKYRGLTVEPDLTKARYYFDKYFNNRSDLAKTIASLYLKSSYHNNCWRINFYSQSFLSHYFDVYQESYDAPSFDSKILLAEYIKWNLRFVLGSYFDDDCNFSLMRLLKENAPNSTLLPLLLDLEDLYYKNEEAFAKRKSELLNLVPQFYIDLGLEPIEDPLLPLSEEQHVEVKDSPRLR